MAPVDDSLALTIENDLNQMARMQQAVSAFLEAHEAAPRLLYAVELALEEMVSNIIKYSYDDDSRHQIKITVDPGAESVVVRLYDDGHEFDPLAAPRPDPNQRLEERRIGGLGIHLVRQVTDGMSYRRERGWNILEMRFPLDRGGGVLLGDEDA
jgi:anti-sigma regulatory factor (Ser/Thr protein kinase)